MLQQVNQTECRHLDWSCQAVSLIDEPCDSNYLPLWYLRAMVLRCHIEDEAWHACAREPGDEGGEA